MTDSGNDKTQGKNLFGVDTNPSNIQPSKLTLDSTIKFRCHPEVSCFTACCGNINIILTPYDILRIRKALNLPADEFLLRFTRPVYLEKTDMPGVKPDGLSIDLRDNVLTIEGQVTTEERPKEQLLLQEYEVGGFRREFRLTNLIDQGKIDASLKDGVLRLNLPKAEIARPRKIEIRTV